MPTFNMRANAANYKYKIYAFQALTTLFKIYIHSQQPKRGSPSA